MNPLLGMGLVSGGVNLLSALAGGQKQKSYYEMSPEERKLFNILMSEYKGGVPSWVTDPFLESEKGIKQHYGRQPASSGLEIAALQKHAYTPMAEASKRHKLGLLPMLSGMTRGGGTQITEMGSPWGQAIGGFGGDIGGILGLQFMMDILMGKQGGGGLGQGKTFLNPSGGFSLGG